MTIDKAGKTDFELIPEIAGRWSPRAFGEQAVETEKLKRVLEAARWAPSSRNEQPWRFIIARKGDEHYQKLFEGLNEFNQKWAWTAPVLGATLSSKHFARNSRPNSHNFHDVGLAMGNLLAQATHEGLHLHQLAGIVHENITENFRVNPNEYDVVTMFVMGYQDESRLAELDEKYQKSEKAERNRKDLTELVFGKEFGTNPDWLK